MLKLTVNNNNLNISESTNFNLTLKSPLNGDSSGSYVFSVTVSYEDNAILFGFPSRLTRMEILNTSVPGTIIYNGINVQKGEWLAKSSTAKIISLEMVIGSGYFNSLVDGHNLPEYFDVPFSFYPSLAGHINGWVTKNYPEANHNFPCILNKSFYGEANELFGDVINNYLYSALDNQDNKNTFIPQLYLLYIIEKLYSENNYTASGAVFDDEYLKTAMLYNNFAIDKLLSTLFSAMVTNYTTADPWLVIWDLSISDPLNQYDETTGKYLIEAASTYSISLTFYGKIATAPNPLNCVIEIYYYDIIVSSTSIPVVYPTTNTMYTASYDHEVIDTNLHGKFYAKVYFEDTSYAHQDAFMVFGNYKIYNKLIPEINVFGHNINYENHVPNMDVKTFLTQTFAAFKIMPFFDNAKKTVELVFLRDLLNNSNSQSLENGLLKNTLKNYGNDYNGLTYKFEFGGPDELLTDNFIIPEGTTGTVDTYKDLLDYAGGTFLVTSLNCYYKYSLIEYIDPDTELEANYFDWVPVMDNQTSVIVDDGTEEVSSALAPLLMRPHISDLGYIRNMPAIEAPGTSTAFNIENDSAFRVFFWAGLQEGINSDPEQILTFEYPLASTTKYNTDLYIVLPINYTWEDLISRYWLPIISWYKRRQKIEFTNKVTPAFIANIDFQNRFFFQKTLVLFSEVVVQIKGKVFGPGKFKGWG